MAPFPRLSGRAASAVAVLGFALLMAILGGLAFGGASCRAFWGAS